MRALVFILTFVALASASEAGAGTRATVKLRVVVSGGTVGVIHVAAGTARHLGCLIDCTYSYPPGTRLTVRAQGAANVTHFVRWSGACTGTKPTCVLVLSKDAVATAKFALGG